MEHVTMRSIPQEWRNKVTFVLAFFSSNRIKPKREAKRLDLSTRIALEAKITDGRVRQFDFDWFKAERDTSLEAFAAHKPARQYLLEFLGPVDGAVMLDIGCGYSMSPVIFALAGATVYAVDVAPHTVSTVQRFARYKGVGDRVRAMVAPGERLPFASESFDLIYGNSALHHMKLELAGPELARVLRCGGRAAFQDPLGENPLLEFARDHLAYRRKHGEKCTDHPLLLRDIEQFGQHFASISYRTFQLTTMVARPLGLKKTSRTRRLLRRVDMALFRQAPWTRRYARLVVTCATKGVGLSEELVQASG